MLLKIKNNNRDMNVKNNVWHTAPAEQGFGRVVYIDQAGEFFLRVLAPPVDDKNALLHYPHPRTEEFIPLTRIFDAHRHGNLQDEYPNLTPKDLRLCSAFLATNVPGHPSYIRNYRGKSVKILFDENLPYGLVSALTEVLPNLSHVYMEGMEGFTDEFIYNRPWYVLHPTAIAERKKRGRTKFIIISRDNDLTDLAQRQWLQRIKAASHPEKVSFGDVNVVFRVIDQFLTNLENVAQFKTLARDIMRRAYSGEAASYTIARTGVYVERGSALHDLIRKVEEEELQRKASQGGLSAQNRQDGKNGRYRGQYANIQAESDRRAHDMQNGLALAPFLP
jgi:predicted nuclease of predicted toxin-antitoxin system